MAEMDELDQLIAARAAVEPAFPAMVDAALAQRALLRQLAARREELGLTQEAVARRLKTKQPNVARLEQGRAGSGAPYRHRVCAAGRVSGRPG